ncbi:MAG: glucosaminidase domain-containing protein [Bacteroidota bacterium]
MSKPLNCKTYCVIFVLQSTIICFNRILPSLMGRTKLYSEPEANNPKQGKSTSQTNRIRRAVMSPGRLVYDAPDALPLSALFRLIWLRVRRNWVAIRFQWNKYTFGVFKKQGALKMSFLVAIAYFLLVYNPESSTISEYFSGKAVETSLDLGQRDGIAKSPKKKAPISNPKSSANPKSNDTAPVSNTELEGDASGEYVKQYAKIAIAEMQKYGVPASISLAQGLIESRAGSSKLAKMNNNHFGMKCFSHNCKPGHCSNYTDDSHKDFFRIFKNPWESWRAHSQMISTGRYAKLKKYGRDYKKWAFGLRSVGYATDHTYSEKLIGVIERYGLNKYDR